MVKYYSKTTKGFYSPDINNEMPDDVVELTDEKWFELINSGKEIKPDENGFPIAVDYEPNEEELKLIELNKIEKLFNQAIENTIPYNNHLYKIKWKDKLINLFNQTFDNEKNRIYDITGTMENSVLMSKDELKELIIILKKEYELYYQSYKKQKEMINN